MDAVFLEKHQNGGDSWSSLLEIFPSADVLLDEIEVNHYSLSLHLVTSGQIIQQNLIAADLVYVLCLSYRLCEVLEVYGARINFCMCACIFAVFSII